MKTEISGVDVDRAQGIWLKEIDTVRIMCFIVYAIVYLHMILIQDGDENKKKSYQNITKENFKKIGYLLMLGYTNGLFKAVQKQFHSNK